MTMKTILLALDGSAESRFAAQAAWQVAMTTHATVVGQHVVDTKALWKLLLHHRAGFVGSGVYFEAYDPMLQQLKNIGERILEAYESFLPEGVTSSTVLSEGGIADEILKQLRSADMLMIGHRHTGDLYDFSESLACRMVQLAEKPVLVVQSQANTWKSVRLVVGETAFNSNFLPEFFDWATALDLRKEVYCSTDADEATAKDVSQKLHDIALPTHETVFIHSALHQTDHEHFGITDGEATLLAIPYIQEEGAKQPLGGPFEIMQKYLGSSLLFWPVEPAIVQKKTQNKQVAA